MAAIFAPSEPIRSMAEGLAGYYKGASSEVYANILVKLILNRLRNHPSLNELSDDEVSLWFKSQEYPGITGEGEGVDFKFDKAFKDVVTTIISFVDSFVDTWFSNNTLSGNITYKLTYCNLIVQSHNVTSVRAMTTYELRREIERDISRLQDKPFGVKRRALVSELEVRFKGIKDEIELLESLSPECNVQEEIDERVSDMYSVWLREKASRGFT